MQAILCRLPERSSKIELLHFQLSIFNYFECNLLIRMKETFFFLIIKQEREDICIFYTEGKEQLKLQLVEQLYETYQLEGYGSSSFSDVRLKSLEVIGKEDTIDLQSLKDAENRMQSFD